MISNYATTEGICFFYSVERGWVAGSTTRDSSTAVDSLTVKDGLMSIGEIVSTEQEGYWLLDGVVIDNPADELGEEFEEVCKYVCTKAATRVFVATFSESEVDSMMSHEVLEAKAKAAKKSAEDISRKLGYKIRVVLGATSLEVWGGPDGFTNLSSWSTTGLFGKPLLVGLDSAALRNEVVAALKPAISDIIKKGECGVHSL